MKQVKKKKNNKKKKKNIRASKKLVNKKKSINNKKVSSKNKNNSVKNKKNVNDKNKKPEHKKVKNSKQKQFKNKISLSNIKLKEKLTKINLPKINFIIIKDKIKNLSLPKFNFKIKNKLSKKISLQKIRINLSIKTRKHFILISIFCLILALLLLFPYGKSNYHSEASGKIIDVPKFSKLSEECCSYKATFTSFRSYTSLKSEMKKIIDSYEKLSCDGKNYYYNKEGDFTITKYGVKKGIIFNEFYITYGKGNSCEIDSTLKNIELLPDSYTIDDAKKDGAYIIKGEKVYNKESYDNFLKDVEEKKISTLRIASLTKEGDLILTDLKYLEDGKYKVIYDGTRDRLDKEDDRVMIAYFYDNIGIYKEKLYAYNGKKITKSMLKTDDVYYLFDIEK